MRRDPFCDKPEAHHATGVPRQPACDESTPGARRTAPAPERNPPALPAPAVKRRRLWQLPAQAHDLLLGLSFEPGTLRALAEQALGRAFGARCALPGGEADVLYSVVLDLVQRNALSEALQAALQRRHAALLLRWRAWRTPEEVQRGWREALASPETDLGGALWALLTHPLGYTLETAALYEARSEVLARARRAAAATRGHAESERALAEHRSRTEALQLQLRTVQREHDLLRQAHEAELAALRGTLRRLSEAPAIEILEAEPASHAPLGRAQPAREPGARARAMPPSPVRADGAPSPAELPPSPEAAAPPADVAVPPAAAGMPRAPAPSPAVMAGRRLLCVGGMPGARHRYRAIAEAAGARFEYHDGGLEDSVARLDRQLASADIVVCHSGCLNHEAYRRVKGHCQRTDKPCIYLERPSLTHFARTLGLPAAER